MKIGIILGSIREERTGKSVAEWVAQQARERQDATYELVDLKSFDIPLLTSATVYTTIRSNTQTITSSSPRAQNIDDDSQSLECFPHQSWHWPRPSHHHTRCVGNLVNHIVHPQ